MFQLPLPSPAQLDEYIKRCTLGDDRDYIERLIARAHQLVSQRFYEESIRGNNNFLKSLWDEYQVALTLVLSHDTLTVNT